MGRPKKEPTIVFGLRILKSDYEELKKEGEIEDRNVSYMVNRLIKNRNGKKKATKNPT